MITTGSGTERTVNCRASSVLPKVYREGGPDAEQGRAIHAYLESLAGGATPDDSLLVVAEEYRTACAELDIASLGADLKLSAEVSLVYCPATDTARVLGQALDRDYSTVGPDEIPMTLDLVGVDLANHRGMVEDYKSGHGPVAPARRNWQLLGGALALSRAYDLDEVDAAILFTRPGETVRRSKATYTAADLMGAASHLRIVAERADADRETYAAGRHVEPTEGPWCRYCPSFYACPAKVGTIALAIGADKDVAITPANVGEVWDLVDRGIANLKAIKSRLIGIAAEQPLLVRVETDGTELWLGKHEKPGNEQLDAKIAIEVAAEVLSIPPGEMAAFQAEIAIFDVTKKAVEESVKVRVKRGQGAPTIKRILEGVRARNGATRGTSEKVDLYTIRRT